MAPSTIGRERTKRRPSSKVCQLTGAVLRTCGALVVEAIRSVAINRSAAATMYTTVGPNTYNTPPRTGPAMTATWKVEEPSATAWPKSLSGTRLRSTACEAGIMKARALPNSTSTANTGQTTRLPLAVKASSRALTSSWVSMQNTMILRRS